MPSKIVQNDPNVDKWIKAVSLTHRKSTKIPRC